MMTLQNIIHVCENNNNLQIGEKIKGIINWEIRYKHMQNAYSSSSFMFFNTL